MLEGKIVFSKKDMWGFLDTFNPRLKQLILDIQIVNEIKKVNPQAIDDGRRAFRFNLKIAVAHGLRGALLCSGAISRFNFPKALSKGNI